MVLNTWGTIVGRVEVMVALYALSRATNQRRGIDLSVVGVVVGDVSVDGRYDVSMGISDRNMWSCEQI
jgi:uncharacterized membrane protein